MTEYTIYSNQLGTYLLKPDLISDQLKAGNFWEPELQPFFDNISLDDIVIEVGSYIGDHTIYLAKRCKQVYTFECNTKNYYQLCANLLLNDCINVEAHNKCIGEASHKVTLSYVDVGNDAGAVYKNDGDGKIQVYSLDVLLLDRLDRLDYLKTDIEGMDLDALKGAKKLISKYSPTVFFEFNKKHSLYTLQDYSDYFKSLNYSIQKLGTWNWIAKPI